MSGVIESWRTTGCQACAALMPILHVTHSEPIMEDGVRVAKRLSVTLFCGHRKQIAVSVRRARELQETCR